MVLRLDKIPYLSIAEYQRTKHRKRAGCVSFHTV